MSSWEKEQARPAEGAGPEDFARFLSIAIETARADESSLFRFLRRWRRLMEFHLSICDVEGARRVLAKAMRWRRPGSRRKARELDAVLAEIEPFRALIEIAGKRLKEFARTGKQELSAGEVAIFIPSKALRLSKKKAVKDLRKVLASIFRQMDSLELPYTALIRFQHHGTPAVPDDVNFVSYHTISGQSNGLHFKPTDRPHCYSFDRKGYSGWSAFAESHPEPVEQAAADAMVEADRASIIGGNVSKYTQPKAASLHADPWVFVALQTVHDNVQKLAIVPMLDMLAEVVAESTRRGIKVIVKRHPRCTDSRVEETLQQGVRAGDFELSEASIHSLIEGSCAVCTVNSSVGAEALLHAKPVYLFGQAEYQYACRQVSGPGDFARIFEPGKLPLSWDETKQFLYSLRRRYANDVNGSEFDVFVRQKILDLVRHPSASAGFSSSNTDNALHANANVEK